MKKLLTIVLLTAMTLSVCACGSDGTKNNTSAATTTGTTTIPEPPDDTPMVDEDYQMDLSKYVTVPKLSEIKISTAALNEKWDEEAKLAKESFAEYVDTAEGYTAVLGDLVNVHYKGYSASADVTITEETLANMTNMTYDDEGKLEEGFDLILGSDSFIGAYESEEHPEKNNPGFEDQLVGMRAGETRTITVTFPDNYGNSQELRGVVIKFDVTVNSVQNVVLPELTDKMVSDYTSEQFKTVAEFQAYILRYYTGQLAYEALTDGAVFSSYPEDQIDAAISEYVYDYIDYTYGDQELSDEEIKIVFDEQYKDAEENAKTTVGNRLVLETLFKELNITLTYGEYKEARHAEFEQYYFYYYYYYGLATEEDMEEYFGRNQLILQFKYNKMMEILPDKITVTE